MDAIDAAHRMLSRRWREAVALVVAGGVLLFPEQSAAVVMWLATEKAQDMAETVLGHSSLG